jgi:hypothetical protein
MIRTIAMTSHSESIERRTNTSLRLYGANMGRMATDGHISIALAARQLHELGMPIEGALRELTRKKKESEK